MAAAMGYQVKFGCDPNSTTPTEQYEVTDLQLRMNEEIIDAAGLRGTRSHVSERVRQNTRAPGLTVTMQPNSVELDTWLPRILGGNENLDVFPLAETLPTFVVTVDVGPQRLNFTGCKVNRATFRSGSGQPLDLVLEIEALDVATSGSAFPNLSISTVGPYIFSDSDSQLKPAGNALQFREWELVIDNQLDVGRFLNSQTRVSLPERDRIITWSWNGPYGDNSALYGLAVGGVASTAKFVLGNRSLLFSSPKVSYPRELPQVSGREEILLPLVGIARKDGSNDELTVTNDSTP